MFADMDHSHFKLATDLLETCFLMYMKTPTGLSPEITYFSVGTGAEEGTAGSDLYIKTNDGDFC
jgi:mannosyl-oligosaccharide alpha-1,2-mannosidase